MLCDTTVCQDDETWDAGYGQCGTYTRANAGNCEVDGACDYCGCACGTECGFVDVCPLDTENDIDSDSLCSNEDSCPFDAGNDSDGDSLCDGDDPCPSDIQNDNDGDALCESLDSCPYDTNNDIDSDNVCADLDVCPYDALDDIDQDGLCADVDSCPFDSDNDSDDNGYCEDSYDSFDLEIFQKLKIMCQIGDMADLVQSSASLQTSFDAQQSSFALNGVELSAEIQMSILSDDVDITFDANDVLANSIAESLGVKRSLLTVDMRLIHNSVLLRDRRMLATVPTWDLVIDLVLVFDNCSDDPLGYDADSDLICVDIDPCPNDAQNDLDSDGMCESIDSCWYDAANDFDSDNLCESENSLCKDDPTLDVGYGLCATYAQNDHNAGRCVEHGVCNLCGCSCFEECNDICPLDAENDADGDNVCGNDDSCPYDSDDDGDGDNLCADEDSCPNDWYNDFDQDGECGDVDECPWRTDLDARTALQPQIVDNAYICSTDGDEQIVILTFQFDASCMIESFSELQWSRPCDNDLDQPCGQSIPLLLLMESNITTTTPYNTYQNFYDDLIALLSYAMELAYTEVYGFTVSGEPKDPVALQFYDIVFDEQESLDIDNVDFTAYSFRVQVPFNATLDVEQAVSELSNLMDEANLDTSSCLPAAEAPVVAFSLGATPEPDEIVDMTWLYVVIACVVILLIIIVAVVIVLQRQKNTHHRKVHMVPRSTSEQTDASKSQTLSHINFTDNTQGSESKPKKYSIVPTPVAENTKEPAKDSPAGSRNTTPRRGITDGSVPDFLHTFARKAKQAGENDDIKKNFCSTSGCT
jgi:hypothetical protein